MIKSLSTRKLKAISALLESPTICEAAKTAGVAESTLYRWMSTDADFKGAYQRLRQEALRQTVAQLGQTGSDAVETLREIMTDKDSPATARVRAARAVLELAIRGNELLNLAERVSGIEEKITMGKVGIERFRL